MIRVVLTRVNCHWRWTSRPPSDALAETLLNEQRFRRLNAQQPDVAEQLWKDAAADLQKRYDFLAQMAGKAD
ncbi:pyruvate-flavodoxin oxidoreductase [Atlantibacter hermannii]|nr:pyruvate-flavodoxin oxidoreductase [Atlantibacter hermannii]